MKIMGASPSSSRLLRATNEAEEWAPEAGSGVRAVLRSGFTRVRYVIESRVAVLELEPAQRCDPRSLSELPDPRRVDVHDARSLAAASKVLSACPACLEGVARHASCSVCLGSCRVEAWVAVRTSRAAQVVVHGGGPARDRHSAVSEPEDFDRTEWPNALVHQAWYRSVPGQLARALHPRLDPQADRVQWVHVQVFVG